MIERSLRLMKKDYFFQNALCYLPFIVIFQKCLSLVLYDKTSNILIFWYCKDFFSLKMTVNPFRGNVLLFLKCWILKCCTSVSKMSPEFMDKLILKKIYYFSRTLLKHNFIYKFLYNCWSWGLKLNDISNILPPFKH